jgi:hypothetical protein
VVSRTKGARTGGGLDPAHVGIPNEFDIALPGTKIIAALAPGRKATRAAECPPPPQPTPPGCTVTPAPTQNTSGGADQPGWMNSLELPINLSVNDDAANVTVAQIDAALQPNLRIGLLNVPAANKRVELNCQGLSYCSHGGTGAAELGSSGRTIPFPAGAEDPLTEMGVLVGPQAPEGLLSPAPGNLDDLTLFPHAASSQIGSGDVVTEQVISQSGEASQLEATLGFVFVTTPALSSYGDTAGDSGTIAYPEPPVTPGATDAALGTGADPIKVAPGPNGHVVMTLKFFRPQRLGISGIGEPPFMDIGNLRYGITAVSPSRGFVPGGSGGCPLGAYLSPSSLAVVPGEGHHAAEGVLVDKAADTPANSMNQVTVTVDLNQCAGGALPVNQPVKVDLSATTASLPTDSTAQTLFVESIR